MKYDLQIRNGCFHSKVCGSEEICQRLKWCFENLNVGRILMGWGIDSSSFAAVSTLVHEHGSELFLWLPVFADLEEIAATDNSMDFRGNSMHGVPVMEGENFLFGCPTSRRNQALPAELVDQYFDSTLIDGVFLDKVRNASFGNGFDSAMGCFCDECDEAYRKKGIDTAYIKNLMSKGDRHHFVPVTTDGFSYTFSDPMVDGFFRAKAENMTRSLQLVAERFRTIGLKVAFDTFAPFAAWFVGQDLPALAEEAAFIKPMLYRRCLLPAGMRFEFDSIVSELGGKACLDQMKCLLNTDDITGDPFFESQLALLSTLPNVSPGIEINVQSGCFCTPEYVKQSLQTVAEAGFDSAVLSWDVVSAPLEHLKTLARI